MHPLPVCQAPPYWRQATAELARRDTVLGPIIARYPGEALRPHGDIFYSLARAVVGQQISVAAAERIWSRLVDRVGTVVPETIAAAGADDLSACGLTRRKAACLATIAEAMPGDDDRWRIWLELDDDRLSTALMDLPGVGPWTCHMILIFAAGRADVLPIADIGLRRAADEVYGMTAGRSGARDLEALAERWRPWRSVATWYLWRLLDPVPVAY